MTEHPIRAQEKLHMHTDTPPEINASNVHKYALFEKSIEINSPTLKKKVALYGFEGGFIYVPSPLLPEVKAEIVKAVLTKLLYPPYRNSIDRALDLTGVDIYQAYRSKAPSVSIQMHKAPKAVIRMRQDPYASAEIKEAHSKGVLQVDPLFLIKKIRWSSLGVYYDWEKKRYDRACITPFPPGILQACLDISKHICGVSSFRAETAVINYYQEKDRIMSHVDRYEEDMSKPLISFSFGCSCAFVLGRKDKKDSRVLSFLLQDGDIAILSGESREYMHGVPRIYRENKGAEEYRSEEYFALIQQSRINISVRQAFKHIE